MAQAFGGDIRSQKDGSPTRRVWFIVDVGQNEHFPVPCVCPDKMSDEVIPPAHEAILLARQGKIGAGEMLGRLVGGKVIVPVSELPKIRENRIEAWRPATVSKANGGQWLVAYTTPEPAAAFCSQYPQYPLQAEVNTEWMLSTLPEGYGIALNFRTPHMFEWNAPGIAKYKKDVLGW